MHKKVIASKKNSPENLLNEIVKSSNFLFKARKLYDLQFGDSRRGFTAIHLFPGRRAPPAYARELLMAKAFTSFYRIEYFTRIVQIGAICILNYLRIFTYIIVPVFHSPVHQNRVQLNNLIIKLVSKNKRFRFQLHIELGFHVLFNMNILRDLTLVNDV